MAATPSDSTAILAHLSGDSLAHLCDAAGIPRGRTLEDRRRRVADAYAGSVTRIVDALKRDGLISALRDLSFESPSGTLAFGGFHKANVAELRKVALAVYRVGWTPRSVDDAPVRGVAVKVYATGELAADEVESTRRVVPDDEAEDVTEGEAVEREVLPTRGPRASDTQPYALEDFQRYAIEALNARFEGPGARGMLCLPTGGGKTRTSMEWLLRTFTARRRRVLWVTHRIDLLQQARDELKVLAQLVGHERPEGLSVSRAHGPYDDLSGDFVFASAQTLARRGYSAESFSAEQPLGIIVYDEAHRAIADETWRAIDRIRTRGGTPILGLTATPFRADDAGTQDLFARVGTPAYRAYFTDLVSAGFLAQPIFETQRMNSTYVREVEPDEIRRTKQAREFPPSVLRKAARDPARNQQIVEHWTRGRARYGKTLVFACNIEHARLLVNLFQEHGARASAVYSGAVSDEERASRIKRFERGELDVLVNVGIMTEGTDIPAIRTVLMARPTLSQSLYVQMIGRGARGPKKVPGKTTFHVVDCVDNFEAHGLRFAGPLVAAMLAEPVAAPQRAVNAVDGPTDRQRTQAAMPTTGSIATDTRTLSFELAWIGPDGYCAVATFRETSKTLESDLLEARRAMDDKRWKYAAGFGCGLERIGAIRADDWERMVADCRATGHRPSLVEIAGCLDGP